MASGAMGVLVSFSMSGGAVWERNVALRPLSKVRDAMSLAS